MITKKDFHDLDILSLLGIVLGHGEIPEGSVPLSEIGHQDVQRGVVSSTVSQRLYRTSAAMSHHIIDIMEQHYRLHQKNESACTCNCADFAVEMRRKTYYDTLLRQLTRQSIIEEHPQVAINNVILKKDWVFIQDTNDWKDIVLVPDKDNIANCLITRIIDALCGSCKVGTDKFESIKEGEELLGEISDSRIRALGVLTLEVRNEWLQQIPYSIRSGDEGALNDLTVHELNRLMMLKDYFVFLSDIISALFCCTVRDVIPDGWSKSEITIRQDWKVVECPPAKDDKDVPAFSLFGGSDFVVIRLT